MTAAAPRKVTLDRSRQELVIEWPDGQRVAYPWSYLRRNCPSAGERVARAEKEANPLAILAQVPSSEIVDLRAVGNYALSFTFADGHHAGIYTWELLRELAEGVPAISGRSGPAGN